MAGHIRDRWMSPDPDNPRKKIRTPRHGKGKRWQATWIEPNGQRKSKMCDTRDEAQAVLDHNNHEIRSHSYVSASAGRVTFGDFFEQYEKRQVHSKRRTRTTMRSRVNTSILPTFQDVSMASITRDMIQDLVNTWEGTYAPGTIELTVNYLTQIFRAAVESEVIAKSPVKKIKFTKPTGRLDIVMTMDEIHAMARVFPDVYARACRFNAGLGLRPSELGGLIWENIEDLEDGTAEVYIDKQIDEWGGARVPLKTVYSERWLLIGPKVRAELGERREGFVFTNRVGRPLNAKGLSSAWSTAREATGLAHLKGWHDVRHFHASALIAGGMSPVAVAKRLGHKDATETLRTYSHLWPDDHSRMAAISDALFTASTERPAGVNPQVRASPLH